MEHQLAFLAIVGRAFLTVYVVFLINREHYRDSFEQCWKGDGLPAFLILVMLYLFIAYVIGCPLTKLIISSYERDEIERDFP